MTINKFYNMMVGEFSELIPALFFAYFFITQKSHKMLDNKLFSESPPVQIFYGIFSEVLEFRDTKEIATLSIVTINDKIFVFDFGDFGANVEFSFMVPFSWYRAYDPDTVEYDFYESGILPQHVYLGKLDLILEDYQRNILTLVSLIPNKYALLVENLSDTLTKRYFCPSVTFSEDEICTEKEINLIIKTPGSYKVYLVWKDREGGNIPIISFKISFMMDILQEIERISELHKNKAKDSISQIEMPSRNLLSLREMGSCTDSRISYLYYAVPEYHNEEDQLVTNPKNGILPIGKYIDFEVNIGNYSRMFVIFFMEYEHRFELWINKQTGFFKRRINIIGSKILVVGERRDDQQMIGIAEYQGVEYSDIGFIGIDKDWLTIHRSEGEESPPYNSLQSQNVMESHSITFETKKQSSIIRIIRDSTVSRIIQAKRLEELIEYVLSFGNDEVTQIVALYLWISDTLILIDEGEDDIPYDIKKILGDKKATSHSIAYLFKEVTQYLGHECFVASGFYKDVTALMLSRSNCYWNIVKIGHYFYIVDCAKSCKLEEENRVSKYIKQDSRKIFYLFPKPEIIVKINYPEEEVYSLISDFKFSFQEFIKRIVVYPYLSIYDFELKSKVIYNRDLDRVFCIRLSCKDPSHNIGILKESSSSMMKLFQKVQYKADEDCFIYYLYFFKFYQFGDNCITLAVKEQSTHTKDKHDKIELGKFKFSISELFETHKSKDKKTEEEDSTTGKKRPFENGAHSLNQNIDKKDLITQIDSFPLISFNLRSNPETRAIENEHLFLYPRYLYGKGETKRTLMLLKQSLNSGKVGEESSFKKNIIILCPSSYYLPRDESIRFLILFKEDYHELLFEGAVESSEPATKIREHVYQYSVKVTNGIVSINKSSGDKIVEFYAGIDEFSREMRMLVE